MTHPGHPATAPRAQAPLRAYPRPGVRQIRIRPSRVALLLVVVAPLLAVLAAESAIPLETRLVGWALWALCFLPVWEYMREHPSARRPIPFLPMIGLLFAWYYARPLVFGTYNEHWRIRLDPTTDYGFAAQVALEGWIMLLLGWKLVLARRGGWKLLPSTFDERRVRSVALILSGIAPLAQFAQAQAALPVVLGGFARLFAGLGYLGLGLLVMRVTEKRATFGEKAWLGITASALIGLQIATGLVSGALISAAVLVLAFWAVRRRLNAPLAVTAVVITLLTVMIKGSTDDFRKAAWRVSTTMSTAEKLSLMATIASGRIEEKGVGGALGAGWRSAVKRSANMDLFADIVRRTPDPIEYWKGRSYVSLVGFAIPRFVWPTKPTKNMGQDFGHRYSLLDPHDIHTSFNLPSLVEFYVNFGEFGVLFGMLTIGVIYGMLSRLANNPGQGALITVAGLVLMLPLLNIESDFSLTFGGLVMDGTALWLVLRKIQGSPSSGRA